MGSFQDVSPVRARRCCWCQLLHTETVPLNAPYKGLHVCVPTCLPKVKQQLSLGR